MNKPHVIVIGAGSTGTALAHDLALRGLRVTILDRGGVAGGTTGHNQGQLHSGARYVCKDPESARECAQENQILRSIAPDVMEMNDGLFIAVDEEQWSYLPEFIDGCSACGVPFQIVRPEQALLWEPAVNPSICAAVRIRDAVFEPYRLSLNFLATACSNGATWLPFTEVNGLEPEKGRVYIRRLASREEAVLQADLVVNAAGPWAGEVARLAGAEIRISANAGVMVTIDQRVCNMVLNLLTPPADGDIIVPMRNSSILGTTSWSVDDVDSVRVPEEDVALIMQAASHMVPAVSKAAIQGVAAATRPLLYQEGVAGREATRNFACIDHLQEGIDSFVSVVGGKTTTTRLMAEAAADLICSKLQISSACRTRDVKLMPYQAVTAL